MTQLTTDKERESEPAFFFFFAKPMVKNVNPKEI